MPYRDLPLWNSLQRQKIVVEGPCLVFGELHPFHAGIELLCRVFHKGERLLRLRLISDVQFGELCAGMGK